MEPPANNSYQIFRGNAKLVKVRINCPRFENAVKFCSNEKLPRTRRTGAHLSNIQAIIHSVLEWTHFYLSDEIFLQETKQTDK